MQEENEVVESPQEVVETQEVVDTQVEQTETPEINEQSEVQETVAEEEPEQTDVNYDLSKFLQPQQQAPQFTPDNDGYIDPNQFYNKVLADAEARIEQKLQFQESERRAWSAIEKQYPEIKEDAELRDLVNAQRIADVASGGKGDLKAVAGKVMGKIQSYQTIGKAQAQVSEKIQKSASLQKSTANNVDASKDSELLGRMRNGDTSAADQLISDWLDAGKL